MLNSKKCINRMLKKKKGIEDFNGTIKWKFQYGN